MNMSKKDIIFSAVTGVITGLIIWRLAVYLNLPRVFGLPYGLAPLIVPNLWLAGIWFGHFLGRWLKFFTQFGKYAAIGFTNAAIDFGILNLMLAYSGINSGWAYPVFRGLPATFAVAHSYCWNKYWVFGAGKSNGGKKELAKFVIVNAVAVSVNISVASVIVNYMSLPNINPQIWANIGAVAGSAAALLFSFIGFKIIVFKKYHPDVI